jgi:hypothetical protein
MDFLIGLVGDRSSGSSERAILKTEKLLILKV